MVGFLSAVNASNVPSNALEKHGALIRGRGPHRLEVGARAAADLYVGIDLTIRGSVKMQVWLPAYVEVRALTGAPGDVDETMDEAQRLEQLRVRHAVVVVVNMSGERRTRSWLAVPVSVVGLSTHSSSLVGLGIGFPGISAAVPCGPERGVSNDRYRAVLEGPRSGAGGILRRRCQAIQYLRLRGPPSGFSTTFSSTPPQRSIVRADGTLCSSQVTSTLPMS